MVNIVELVDRLSGVSTLKDRIAQLDKVLEGMQRIQLEQQRALAELQGQVRALIAINREMK